LLEPIDFKIFYAIFVPLKAISMGLILFRLFKIAARLYSERKPLKQWLNDQQFSLYLLVLCYELTGISLIPGVAGSFAAPAMELQNTFQVIVTWLGMMVFLRICRTVWTNVLESFKSTASFLTGLNTPLHIVATAMMGFAAIPTRATDAPILWAIQFTMRPLSLIIVSVFNISLGRKVVNVIRDMASKEVGKDKEKKSQHLKSAIIRVYLASGLMSSVGLFVAMMLMFRLTLIYRALSSSSLGPRNIYSGQVLRGIVLFEAYLCCFNSFSGCVLFILAFSKIQSWKKADDRRVSEKVAKKATNADTTCKSTEVDCIVANTESPAPGTEKPV